LGALHLDASIFARQLTQALDNLTAGISIDPGDIDQITGARVLSFADAEYLTDDAGFEITAPTDHNSRSPSCSAPSRAPDPAIPATAARRTPPWIPRS
jgi:hypothetical protein